MDEIFEIRIWDKDENETYVMLPTSKYDVMDAMEQARIGENYSVQVTDSDYIPELCKFEFKGTDIDDLLVLAKRIAEMQEEYGYNKYAYRAFLFGLDKSADVSEMLKLTYGVSSVPVFPCRKANIHLQYDGLIMLCLIARKQPTKKLIVIDIYMSAYLTLLLKIAFKGASRITYRWQ